MLLDSPKHSHVRLLIHLELYIKNVAEQLRNTAKMIQNAYYHISPKKEQYC